jgi:hypothetical protein
VRIAEFTLVTEIDNLTNSFRWQLRGLTIDFVNTVEQHIKRGAQIIAAPTTMTDIKNSGQFLINLVLVPK